MFGFIDKIIGSLNKSIATFGIAAGVVLAFVNVVARYGFNGSIVWASDLTNYFFIWSTFFGAAYCFKKDAHISVSILIDAYYGYKFLRLEIMLQEVSVDLVVPKITWLGMSSSWSVPMWIIYLAIPVAFASAAIRVFEKLVEIIKTPAELARRESEAEMIISR